jgi:hypothetical protein
MTLLRLELSFSRLESLHVAGSFSSVSSKQIVKELLENLPDETTLLEIAHEIEFLDGLRSGLEEAFQPINSALRSPAGRIQSSFRSSGTGRPSSDCSVCGGAKQRGNRGASRKCLNRQGPNTIAASRTGRIVPELKDSAAREIFFKTYRIVYRIKGTKVQVIRFWHAARGAPEIDSDQFWTA